MEAEEGVVMVVVGGSVEAVAAVVVLTALLLEVALVATFPMVGWARTCRRLTLPASSSPTSPRTSTLSTRP